MSKNDNTIYMNRNETILTQGGSHNSTSSKDFDRLSTNDIYKLADLYFKQKNIMYTHLYNSFDKFIDDDIRLLLEEGNNNTFFEKITKDKVYRYKFVYENVALKPPVDNDNEIITPQQARTRNLVYSCKLVATITQVQDTIDIATGEITSKVIGTPEKDYPIATIPIMVRSKYCTLNIKKGSDYEECSFDPGGYFIVKGSEKVVMSLERMIENKPLVFTKKDMQSLIYNVQVNSKSYGPSEMIQIISIRMKKDGLMKIRIPILNEVPVFTIFRALGIESDKEIINMISYDQNDIDIINYIKLSLDDCVSGANEPKIMTQQSAYNYLIQQMRVIKKYSETDKDIRLHEKKMHLEYLLLNNFLPHIEPDTKKKALYLGYMINRLLQVRLGRIKKDDRDSFVNKRVDLPGNLMFELFKQYYKKMLNECSKNFKKRNDNDDNPINIINQIKPNIIEQGLLAALSTGNWGKKKGVAQMLQRITYMFTIASLRRINSPTVDASTNKLTSPRHLHGTQIPCICFIETSEGHNVGLVKGLTLIGNITVMLNSQFALIKNMMNGKLIDLHDATLDDFRKYTKVFLNGEWLGLTDSPKELFDEFKKKKLNGEIDPRTSIVHEVKTEIASKEIKIYCDGGRLYRPVICVNDNNYLLKKKHIDMISLDNIKTNTTITSWNEFLLKFPGVIEYLDIDENTNSMIAMYETEVIEMKKNELNSIELAKKMNFSNNIIMNRYDDLMFIKYTHCEIHPSLLFGNIAANIPFANHNQGPRNMYQYSQSRQAMGIYASNYRDRLDISYILYNPQKPIVNTRTMKYIGTDKLPYGENVIVAICCYAGYNQEDSVMVNQSAIDCGLYSSSVLKKYISVIQKNQSTSRDDVFIKPDKSKVAGMRYGSYDKLNEKGYAPEETKIENGDIILGKVSPIQPVEGSNYTFKDNSEAYKSGVSARVDRVWTNLHTQEGYEMRKMRMRSLRIPHIGDKMCCYTDEHDVLTNTGWVNIKDLTLDHKVASLDDDGETLKYINPIELQNYDYKGNIYIVDSTHVKLSVTPNHRMYVGNRYKKWEIKLADDIVNKMVYYKKNVKNVSPDMSNDVPNLKRNNDGNVTHYVVFDSNGNIIEQYNIDSFLALYGVWLAEGWIVNKNQIGIAVHKQIIKDKLEEIQKTLNIIYTKSHDDNLNNIKNIYYVSDKNLVNIFGSSYTGKIQNDIYKKILSWVWSLSKKQCNILLHSMMLGDGHWGMWNNCKTPVIRYDTSSITLRNDFQKLSLHCGFSANYYLRYKKGTQLEINNSIAKRNADSWRLTVFQNQNEPQINKDLENKRDNNSYNDKVELFDGKVYCCTVPTKLGVIYVKKNGCPVWSGNSRSGQKGTIGLTLPCSDMPFTENGLQPDIIINPNCIPSRMTIGQLVEGLVAKVSAYEGHESDGTVFNDIDIDEAKKRLEKFGVDKSGYEYMYNGITGRKMKNKIFITPTYYQRLKHLVSDKMHCLTLDHLVLTIDGLKKFNQLTYNDKIATLHNGNLVYEKPTELIYYGDYKGQLYNVKSTNYNLSVTTNHRMYVSHDGVNYDLIQADNIYGKNMYYKNDANWQQNDLLVIFGKIYDNIQNVNNMLILFGYWLRYMVTFEFNVSIIFETITEKNIICDIVKGLDLMYLLYYNKIVITDIDLSKNFKSIKTKKKLPNWIWTLSQQQMKLLVDIVIDQNKNYSKNDFVSNEFMRMCLHAGVYCKQINSDEHNKFKYIVYTKTIHNTQQENVTDYEGPVYCLQVPHEVFCVFRDGSLVWTGNSRARGVRTMLTKQPPEGRSKDGGLRFGEMERDCIISHGMARFLKERLMETADAYTTRICNTCGFFAQRMLKKDNRSYATVHDIYFCQNCKTDGDVHKIRIPYAFKLLIQEMMSMNVAPRIKIKKTEYN
jgi:DNA-directed RNA polymerase II subunit RPB2